MAQPEPRLKAVHFLNQFFAGQGGEEQGGLEPLWLEGAVGPGRLLEREAAGLEIVGTLVAGDNYMAEALDSAVQRALEVVAQHVAESSIDLFIAGPAFNAGRYGLACAALCQALKKRYGWAAVTAMHPENPAVDGYRREVVIVRTAGDVMGMKDAVAAVAGILGKLVSGAKLLPERDGIIARGLRQNYMAVESGAERAIAMLLRKLRGEDYVTEYPMPSFDRVRPAPPIADASRATVALITSGGIVPAGNPDRIESSSASRWGQYSIEGVEALSAFTHQSVHGGYDPTYANEDPNRVLPLDMARALEREKRIGRLFPRYFATVGNGTSVAQARRFGAEIAALLVNEGVQAVIFTST